MSIRDILPQTVRASELYGDFWFNSEPVPVSALRGSVILIAFWDFTCDACLRSLPYLKEWHRKYAKYGLTVVGVHAPRFPFGKDPEAVQRAIHRLGVRYPVVMDNGHQIASRYDSRTWPSMYLIDKDGFIRYIGVGEGNYTSTEHVVQTLLYDAGVGEELPLLMEPVRDADRAGAVCYRPTPELLAGYLRGTIGNVEGYSPESVVRYQDPGLYLDGRIYAAGDWLNEKDSLRLERAAQGAARGQLIVNYQGLEASGVFDPRGAKGVHVVIEQDGHALVPDVRGDDVRSDARGRSLVAMDDARLYSLVRNREYGEHVLRLSVDRDGFILYSFAFSTAAIPELVSNS